MVRLKCHWLVLMLIFFSYSVSAQVTAGFTIVPPSNNCNPAIYSFANTSTGTGLTYSWNFGVYPGVNSVFTNPSTTYLDCGTFTVKLVVTDTTGAKDSTTQTVNIRCSPIASFSPTVTTGCQPLASAFNNTSTPGSGSITSSVWDFGDGSIGSGANPSHTYNSAGCKNVTLIVTNSFNCVSDTTLNNVVCVNPLPIVNFNANTTTSCAAPLSTNYQSIVNSGNGPYTYQWTFQGGQPSTASAPNPTVVYNSPGSFATTLIVTDANGCADTLVKNNYIVISNYVAGFTIANSQRCASIPTRVTANSTNNPIGWQWTVTPAINIPGATTSSTNLTFPTGGSYDICLTTSYAGGCSAQQCTTLVINNAPTAGFGTQGLLNTCLLPNPVTFIDSSVGQGLLYAWSFPGGSPSIANTATPPIVTYDSCGSYAVTLTVENSLGCRSTISKPNLIELTCPQTSYTVVPSTGCLPLTASFSGTATGTPVAWLWNFDDLNSGANNTSTLQNPTHIFNTAGCYEVRLTTTDIQGCTSNYSLPAAVCAGARPLGNFSANPPTNCANQPIYFADSSTGTFVYTQYVWGYTDTTGFVNFSVLQNPNHTFYDAGIWDITLIVSNYGCADTITKDDLVRTLVPVSSPRVRSNCSNPLSVTLDGSTSEGADHYSWIILGGSPANDTSATLVATFPGPGSYTASLLVSNDSTGCTDFQTVVVNISNYGAAFTGTPLTGCAPLVSCFSSFSTTAISYDWQAIDANGTIIATDSITSPCFTFTEPGAYDVQLIVADSLGCIDTVYKPQYVIATGPAVNFIGTPVLGCAPLNVSFTDSSVGIGLAQWNWSFGDSLSAGNNTSTQQNPTHLYNRGGKYSVLLSVTDSNTCTADTLLVDYIQVNEPNIQYTDTTTLSCQGSLTCYTINPIDTSLDYFWDFGDGTLDTSVSPCHLYTQAGIYNAMVTVIDNIGCTDTVLRPDTSRIVNPQLDFVADTTFSVCPPLAVSFTNLSTGIDSAVTWNWSFGNGQISTFKDPFHIYTSAGLFTVTLISTTQSGCSDTLIFPDYIDISGPSAFIATAPTSGCVPHTTCMSATTVSATNITWNFGDGTVLTGASDSVCYTYTRTGSFYPELILGDAGCIFSLPMGRVDVVGTAAGFSTDTTELCGQGTVSFTDTSNGTSAAAAWLWTFGDSVNGQPSSSPVQNPTHTYASPGTYRVTQNVVSTNGCLDSAFTFVTVYPLPNPSVSVSDSTPCAPETVFFTSTTGPANSINSLLWNFGDTLSGTANTSTLQNPSHNYTTSGTYTVSLTEVDTNGCTAATNTVVFAKDNPVATFTAQDTCLDTQPIVFTNGTLNSNTYSWSFGDGNSSTQQNPTHSYADTGIYAVSLITLNDYCSDTATGTVQIFGLPVADFSLSANTICGAPASFSLTNLSTQATSYLWDFGNNSTSTLTNPSADYTAVGNYNILLTATSINGCIDTASRPVTVYPKPDLQNLSISPAEGCQPLEVTFDANGAIAETFVWNFGTDTTYLSTGSSVASYTYPDTGSYSISLWATSVDGCKDTLVLTDAVTVYGLPVATFDAFIDSTSYPYDGTVVFTNTSQNANSYYWDFGDGNSSTETNPSHRFDEINIYTAMLIASTNYNCLDTAFKQLNVYKKALYVPNALQPDYNGVGELVQVWKPNGIGLKTYKAQIFDQWGKLLWQSEMLDETRPAEGWDGTYNGVAMPQDVYVWKIEAVFVDGAIWPGMSYPSDEGGGTKTIGSVTLVR